MCRNVLHCKTGPWSAPRHCVSCRRKWCERNTPLIIMEIMQRSMMRNAKLHNRLFLVKVKKEEEKPNNLTAPCFVRHVELANMTMVWITCQTLFLPLDLLRPLQTGANQQAQGLNTGVCSIAYTFTHQHSVQNILCEWCETPALLKPYYSLRLHPDIHIHSDRG